MSERFRPDDERLLAAHLERIRPLYCRLCGTCGGVCEKGVRVAGALPCLTYADGYGQFALARQSFLAVGSAPAALCRTFVACSVRCPNGVDVRAPARRGGIAAESCVGGCTAFERQSAAATGHRIAMAESESVQLRAQGCLGTGNSASIALARGPAG